MVNIFNDYILLIIITICERNLSNLVYVCAMHDQIVCGSLIGSTRVNQKISKRMCCSVHTITLQKVGHTWAMDVMKKKNIYGMNRYVYVCRCTIVHV